MGALLLFCTAAQAQISFGPAAGFHLTSYNKNVVLGKRAMDMQIGAAADIPLSHEWHFQPGVYYTSNSYPMAELGSSITHWGINTIDIPLSITYRTGMKRQSHFFFGVGAFAAINVGGHANVLFTNSAGEIIGEGRGKFTFGTDTPATFRRLGAGYILNAGYQLKNGIFVRLHYQRALRNITPAPIDRNYITVSNNFGLTAGYFFHQRTRKERKEKTAKPKPQY